MPRISTLLGVFWPQCFLAARLYSRLIACYAMCWHRHYLGRREVLFLPLPVIDTLQGLFNAGDELLRQDPASRVANLQSAEGSWRVFEELGTEPSVRYLRGRGGRRGG